MGDVQVGDDPISHVHVTHFTGWFSSTIVDPKRVAVAHDVFCMGYEGGEGKNLVKRENVEGQHPYRFMFENKKDNGSVFVMLAPKEYGAFNATGTNAPNNPIDLGGDGTSVPCGADASKTLGPDHHFNEVLWGFKRKNQGAASGQDAVEEASKFSQEPCINMVCFQTMQKVISTN